MTGPPALDDFSPIGAALRARREELGLLQKQVAAKLGCSIACISMIERGARLPSMSFLNKLSRVLNSTVTIGLNRTSSISRDSTQT